VMFMRTWPATFTSLTYPASGATTQYISDLTPNTSYTISGTGAPTSATTDTAGVLTFTAAGTGNITINSSTPPAKVSQIAASHVSQYEIPLFVSVAAVSLLMARQVLSRRKT
jgi:hypothetical protein